LTIFDSTAVSQSCLVTYVKSQCSELSLSFQSFQVVKADILLPKRKTFPHPRDIAARRQQEQQAQAQAQPQEILLQNLEEFDD